MYLSKLADGGVLIFNTTNRYVRLEGILRDLADELDLTCYHFGAYNNEGPPLLEGSDYVVLQRRHLDLDNSLYNGGPPMPDRVLPSPLKNRAWTIPEKFGGPIWDDRYSNLLKVMKWY